MPLDRRARVVGAEVTVTVPRRRRHASAVARGAVPTPELWWPVGHGAQPLYELDVDPRRRRRAASTRWHRRIGFRTVELDTSADEHGTALRPRDQRPPDLRQGRQLDPRRPPAHPHHPRAPARAGSTRPSTPTSTCCASGAAGSTSPRTSTTLCDERGLLVWQDFLFACAAYPEEEPLRDELEAEARENVARLTPHPSLVLWNGGNENLWGFEDWGWQEELAGTHLGLPATTTSCCPSVVAELDPTRPYSAGQPVLPGAALAEVHPNDPDHGTLHQWEVWNRVDYTRLPRRRPPLLLRVRLPGPADLGDPRRARSHAPTAAR